MDKVSEEEIQEARNKFIGKWVIVKDAIGKTTIRENNNIAGEITFIGYNAMFPSWGLCATVGRTPLQNIKLENIKLHERNI